MFEFFVNNFIVLFVVMDPIGIAPVFGALIGSASKEFARHMAIKGVVTSGLIMLFFMFAGHVLLNALGISFNAFRVAGGFFLLLLAIDMVFARQSGLRSTTRSERAEAQNRQDISVFPLAIPLIAGPGALTSLLLMMGEADGRPEYVGAILVISLSVLLMILLALLSVTRIMRWMGETGSNVVSRILGILLGSLAVQYMLDGIIASFPALQAH